MASVGGAFGHKRVKRHHRLSFVAPVVTIRNIHIEPNTTAGVAACVVVARDTPKNQPVGHITRLYPNGLYTPLMHA